MKLALFFPILLSTALNGFAAGPLNGFPFTDESLNYSINWPSGLSLGEAHLRAKHAAAGWNFEFTIDAGIPGFSVKDAYTSNANPDLCSMDFTRQFLHGTHKGGEKETIDRSHATVERVTTAGGGKSEFAVSDCMKDALAFLFYSRRELGQGRVPPAQQILFGGLYEMRVQYVGAPVIKVSEKQEQSDKVVCSVKGPSSSVQFEVYFARDAARTPLMIKVPLQMGSFSMELVR